MTINVILIAPGSWRQTSMYPSLPHDLIISSSSSIISISSPSPSLSLPLPLSLSPSLSSFSTRRSYVRLKFNYFLTECLWDYLHIFNGDSIYSPKLAAYSYVTIATTSYLMFFTCRGEVLHHDTTTGSIDGGSGSMYGSGDVTYVSPNEVVLSFDSPHVLFHFFSDAEQVNDGFNISYW